MLSSLHIENIAVIKSVDIDFGNGFSAFTGETGAGKSILIDSINLLLGNRADRELIRKGEERALISAVFDSLTHETRAALSAVGIEPDEDGLLMIQLSNLFDQAGLIDHVGNLGEYYSLMLILNGSSRSYVNLTLTGFVSLSYSS